MTDPSEQKPDNDEELPPGVTKLESYQVERGQNPTVVRKEGVLTSHARPKKIIDLPDPKKHIVQATIRTAPAIKVQTATERKPGIRQSAMIMDQSIHKIEPIIPESGPTAPLPTRKTSFVSRLFNQLFQKENPTKSKKNTGSRSTPENNRQEFSNPIHESPHQVGKKLAQERNLSFYNTLHKPSSTSTVEEPKPSNKFSE